MKKLIIGITLVGVIALAAFSAVDVAQAETPEPPATRRGGPGGSPGGGPSGEPRGSMTGDEILHDYIVANLAPALGISVEELESRLAEGDSFMQIAMSLGYDYDTASEMIANARAAAIEQALADGVITEEQAEIFRSNMGGANGSEGSGSGSSGGKGPSGSGYDGDCPYDDTSD